MLSNKVYYLLSFLFILFFSLFFTYPSAKTVEEYVYITIPKSQNQKIEKVQNQLDCLADNIYYEARGEGRAGWLAVGMVTMNRVLSRRYPNTVCEVVYQNNGKVYQFSWAKHKKTLTKSNVELYNEIRELALDILIYHQDMNDNTRGALFFHAEYVRPWWSKKKTKTVRIGRHIFYKI